jgi:hypothetical protein
LPTTSNLANGPTAARNSNAERATSGLGKAQPRLESGDLLSVVFRSTKT